MNQAHLQPTEITPRLLRLIDTKNTPRSHACLQTHWQVLIDTEATPNISLLPDNSQPTPHPLAGADKHTDYSQSRITPRQTTPMNTPHPLTGADKHTDYSQSKINTRLHPHPCPPPAYWELLINTQTDCSHEHPPLTGRY